jgi:hypothetical protein
MCHALGSGGNTSSHPPRRVKMAKEPTITLAYIVDGKGPNLDMWVVLEDGKPVEAGLSCEEDFLAHRWVYAIQHPKVDGSTPIYMMRK